MKLINVRIKNYKCIEDSNAFSIDDVTCLVGKNESGKSALLEAIEKLNPIDASNAGFHELDFPRRRQSQAKQDNSIESAEALVTTWQLDESDQDALKEQFCINPIKGEPFERTQGYGKGSTWAISVKDIELVKAYLDDSKLNEAEKKDLADVKTIENLISKLSEIPDRSQNQQELLDLLNADFKRGTATLGVIDFLVTRLPKVLYFSEYYRMPGRASVEEIKRLKASGQLEASHKVFLALLALASTKLDDFENVHLSEQLYANLEGVSNRITDEIFEFWSQNKNLEVEFKYDQGRSEDPAPFNSGWVFSTRIKNTRHRASVNFDERSTGFIWFFSFLVWFSQVKQEYGENLLILLDEPGLALHAKAQADLLRYINERLKGRYQVIYTTHSPFMIDPENLMSVRTVEDKVGPNNEVEGTKVGDAVLSADKDTLMPLMGALGIEITQTLFVGPHTIIVEGPGDILYLTAMSSELKKKGRTGLDPRWTIAPAGGLDKVQSFVSLFSSAVKNIAVLTDFATGDRNKIENLRKSKLLADGRILTAEKYAGQAEADIEDILGRDAYIALVNMTYELKGKSALPAKKPSDAPMRCLKEVEAHMALQADKPEFDHFAPSRYLIENLGELAGTLPGFDAALQRFEEVFKDLNKLLDLI